MASVDIKKIFSPILSISLGDAELSDVRSSHVPILAISSIEHFMWCRRQCALIHIEGLWVDSEATSRGTAGHKRADSGQHRRERGRFVLRSIPLWSEQFGMTGRADIVEVLPDGSLEPVEYKIGLPHGKSAILQLCAQALCLEEMTGSRVAKGSIYYSASRNRHNVVFDEQLRLETLETVAAIKLMLQDGKLPYAVDDQRCPTCQLIDLCQPTLVAHPAKINRYLERELWRVS